MLWYLFSTDYLYKENPDINLDLADARPEHNLTDMVGYEYSRLSKKDYVLWEIRMPQNYMWGYVFSKNKKDAREKIKSFLKEGTWK